MREALLSCSKEVGCMGVQGYCITNVKQNRLERWHFKQTDHQWDREDLTADMRQSREWDGGSRHEGSIHFKLFQSQTERVRFGDLEIRTAQQKKRSDRKMMMNLTKDY